MKRKIVSIFLAVLMVLSLCVPASAAETTALDLDWSQWGNNLSVDALLTAKGATNGRLVITYDPSLLTLKDVSAGDDSWIVSIDTDTAGEIAFAWVASDITNPETRLVTVDFKTKTTASGYKTDVDFEITELYDNGKAMTRPEEETLRVTSEGISVPSKGNSGSGSGNGSGSGSSSALDDIISTVTNPFTDISGHWAEDEIISAYLAGLVNGLGDGRFGPDEALNRAMFTTLLYRLAGSPAVSGSNPFTDVANGVYYTDAVIWAYQNGVVTGTSATTFDPNATLTREQMVTMLYRYAQFAGIDTSASTSLSSFTDSASVSGYAVNAMQWAVAEGIIKGQGNALVPAGTTTRAQAAAVLVRFVG